MAILAVVLYHIVFIPRLIPVRDVCYRVHWRLPIPVAAFDPKVDVEQMRALQISSKTE
mgnify:FL=1